VRILLLVVLAIIVRAESVDSILARMNSSAKSFKSVSATTKRDEYVDVLKESSTQTGQILVKRSKGSVVALMKFDDPDPRSIHIEGHNVQIFYPKVNTVNVYDAGKYAHLMDQLILLGFGTSGTELAKEYDIQSEGAETIASRPTTHLKLIPKSAELQKGVKSIELWIPENQSWPLQEKITQPSKDYSLIHFSDVRTNPPLPDSAYDLKMPPNVKVINPNK
jgi:outer membrane lipoprotein-sorting protein